MESKRGLATATPSAGSPSSRASTSAQDVHKTGYCPCPHSRAYAQPMLNAVCDTAAARRSQMRSGYSAAAAKQTSMVGSACRKVSVRCPGPRRRGSAGKDEGVSGDASTCPNASYTIYTTVCGAEGAKGGAKEDGCCPVSCKRQQRDCASQQQRA